METFKTFKAFKNCSKDCLWWSNKNWKAFSEEFQTKQTLHKSFWGTVSLSQKTVSTSSLKTSQKTEKCPFQTLRTFTFELKVASKPFSKKLPITKFWFKQFLMFCLTFSENGFNLVTQKFVKNRKMLFSNAQNIRFWVQGSFKTIF